MNLKHYKICFTASWIRPTQIYSLTAMEFVKGAIKITMKFFQTVHRDSSKARVDNIVQKIYRTAKGNIIEYIEAHHVEEEQ